jgi:ribosomal-protein-alanine N-acetyltransferase
VPLTGITVLAVGLAVRARALTVEEAEVVAGWRYEPPFDFYNGNGGDSAGALVSHDPDGYGYFPIEDGHTFVGYVCFGPEGRVTGQADEAGTCDVGIGLAPQWVGQGVGTSLVPAIVEFAIEKFGPQRFRVAVASFNARSLRLCASAGFVECRRFDGPRNQEFVELVRDA